MNEIINSILIAVLIINIITDYRKTKSNKEVVQLDSKIIKSHEELKSKLSEKMQSDIQLKETFDKVINCTSELKDNLIAINSHKESERNEV